MLTAGTLRACWPIGLAFVRPGAAGLVLVIAVQFGLVTCMGVFNPVFATYRLEHTAPDRVARTLSAWSVSSNATIAAHDRALGPAGRAHQPPHRDRRSPACCILATPLLLPRRDRTPAPELVGQVERGVVGRHGLGRRGRTGRCAVAERRARRAPPARAARASSDRSGPARHDAASG